MIFSYCGCRKKTPSAESSRDGRRQKENERATYCHDELPPVLLSLRALHLVLVERSESLVIVVWRKEVREDCVEVCHKDVVDARRNEKGREDES